jgi:LmbE family N-acetylglucosaminyl deacetylase
MVKIKFEANPHTIQNILCLGAHSDDIEIGCGGTVLKLAEQYPDIRFKWVVFSASGERASESSKSAQLFLHNVKHKDIVIKNFKDGFFPYSGNEIKEYFELLKYEFSPDIILTHYGSDLHQDHRMISDLTWNTFRNHLILEYETIKYDGDVGKPNFFVDLNYSECDKKIKYLLESFHTQKSKHWFTEDSFLSILRLRGIEANAKGKYAEAYYCRKIVF